MKNEKLTQRIESLVNQEILLCQSSLVEAMLENGMASYDDIENTYKDNSEEIEELQNEVEEIKDNERYIELDDKYEEIEGEEEIEYNNFNKEIEKLESKIEELEQEQETPQEAYEWWAVTEWFANKLRGYNELILDNDYGTWWGRSCSGQAIKMDYIIEQIAKDLI